MSDPIHSDGRGWYFWDETGADRYGPYATREIAKQAMDDYCREILGIDPEEST
jgi:hypothetical protein